MLSRLTDTHAAHHAPIKGQFVSVNAVGSIENYDSPVVVKKKKTLPSTSGTIDAAHVSEVTGMKTYEYTNHLGNVLMTTNDKRLPLDSNSDDIIDGFAADVRSYSDYYPYGMPMVGRNSDISSYRFGFNDMEVDNEMKGNGNSLDFGARIYDSRLGKFFSIDPKAGQYPSWSPYLFAGNSPIRFIDEYGEGPGDRVKKSKSLKKPGYRQEKGAQAPLRNGTDAASLEYMDCSEHVCRVLADDGLTEGILAENTDLLYIRFNETEKDKWVKSSQPQIGDIVLWTAETSGNDWGHTAIVESYDEKTRRVRISHHTRYGDVSGYENASYRLGYFQNYGASFYRPSSESQANPSDPTLIYGPYWVSKMIQVSAKGNGGGRMDILMANNIPGSYTTPDQLVPRNIKIPTEEQIDIAISTVDAAAAGALKAGKAIGGAVKNVAGKIGGMFKKAPPVKHKSVRFL